jgi:superfamily I DNA/RNA helicase
MANQFISNNPERTERHLTPSRVNCDGSVIVYQWESMEQEARGLATLVKNLVQASKVELGEVLVLAPPAGSLGTVSAMR